ncbi:MAG: tripartite tricarboxylate transporter substrate binding protein [Proteobacteria bacterium]|nr:tripartite tricarboxylate transporter substrate binding protein [Pseudomonadota bacterium]
MTRHFGQLIGAAVFLATVGAAVAQDFPTKPITLVVTYPPGGGADIMARLIAPKLGEALGQSIVVENKPGAAGQVGAAFVANAKPDGYTVMIDAASFVINQGLYPKLPYDAEKAFRPIGVVAAFPHVVVVTPGFEANSAPDLVAMAKAKPGAINYASSGTGSAQHLAGAAFIQQTKVNMTHVPYKGGGPAMNDVMGGHIPVFFANVASGLSHIKGGKLRALAVASDKRIAALPDVPALGELGIGGGAVFEWNGMFVPAGTPDAVVGKLTDALDKALQAPEIKQRITDLGGEIIGGGAAGAATFIAGQKAVTGKLIRDGNITPD